jgi:hypothetical protein
MLGLGQKYPWGALSRRKAFGKASSLADMAVGHFALAAVNSFFEFHRDSIVALRNAMPALMTSSNKISAIQRCCLYYEGLFLPTRQKEVAWQLLAAN